MDLNRYLALWSGVLLLGLAVPVQAHNGALAIAVPVEGVEVDGDLSDWPENMRRYPIALPEYGDKPKGPGDFQGSFRIGYNALEDALYVAVEIQDESVIKVAPGGVRFDTQDGCEVYVDVSHKEEDVPVLQYVIWGNTRVADPEYGKGTLADVKVEVKWGERGYRYEWRIDVGKLSKGQAHLKPGMGIAFDLTLWDKDQDGSATWMAWGPGTDKYGHSARLGWVSLSSGDDKSGDSLVMEVEQAETTPQIDGDVAEWPDAQWHRFAPGSPHVSKAARNQPLNDGATEPPGTAGTAADLSGSFALQWDEEWLYLAARVTDNVHDVRWSGAGRAMGFEDAVSLFLDIPSDGDGPAWISGDHAFTFLPDPAYPADGKWWRYGDNTKQPVQQQVPAPPETRLAVRLGAGGDYTLEAAIPISALTKLTPAFHAPLAGRMVGFMFLVADPDGGSDDWGGQIIYGGDDDNDANWMRLRFRPAGTGALQMGRLEGRVKWEDTAEGLAYGKVRIQSLTASDFWVQVSADSQGVYSAEVPIGKYRVEAGYRRQKTATDVEVKAGETAQVAEISFARPPLGKAGPVVHEEVRMDPVVVPAPILMRLSYWVPPERMAEFEAVYQEQILPLLKQHGLVESSRRGRATVDSVFSRLFEAKTLAETQDKMWALSKEPPFREMEKNLGKRFGTAAGPDSILRRDFRVYAMPAGPGERVLAGPGTRQGVWQNLDVPDGLGGMSVVAVLEDRKGDLWFGLSDGAGLSHYDGRYFTTFTTKDGLGADKVSAILEDKEGVLWFGTDRGGVSRYDGHQFTAFTAEDGLGANNVRAILQDREGVLWFGTDGGGVSRYDGHQFTTFTANDGLSNTSSVTSIVEDQQGNLWFGTWGGGVSRYDGKRVRTFTTADGLVNNVVKTILEDQEGQLWFGGHGGISRYDGMRFTAFTTPDLLLSAIVESSIEDRQGGLWFGTYYGGVIRCEANHFASFRTNDSGENTVFPLMMDRKGVLWFGSYAEGVYRYDGQTLKAFSKDWNRETVGAALEDRNGTLWFSMGGAYWENSRRGVVRYDGQTFRTFTDRDGLVHATVTSIVEDLQGNLWFGTRGGVSRFDGEGFRSFTTQDGLADNRVYSMLVDREGRLWFATDGGVSCYDGKGFKTFTKEDGLGANDVESIAEDQQGNLWFGTWGGGVTRYDRRGFKTFTTQDGLANNVVVSIELDRKGHLWFGTMGGVSQYDGLVFQTLSKQDGVASNRVYHILQDRQGDIWLGTLADGVTRYHPQSTPPAIAVSDVVSDHRYGPIEQLSLPTSQRYLAFEFGGKSYGTRRGQMAYAYQLTGYDKEWRWTREEKVEYTDLPRGEYVFQVKAVDRDLNYSEEPATVKVTIHPPYGQITLVGGLGLALVGLVFASSTAIRRRRAFLREQTARLQAQEALNRELEEELQTAHTLQMDLMPRESPQIPGLDLAGRCIPANHVGGDLFQYFQQDGKLSIALADVTGHAMEAAIPMVMFSGVLRSQIEIGGSVEDLFGRLNRSLHNAAGSRTFVCFSLGTIDTDTSTLRLSSAAFPYPYHFSAATGEIAELRVDAYPLGVRPDTRYAAIERQLAPGDYLVFCSDGIVEATDGAGAQFGYDRTAASLRSGCMAGLSAEALLERVVAEVREFRGDTPQGDDQTVVVLKVGEAG